MIQKLQNASEQFQYGSAYQAATEAIGTTSRGTSTVSTPRTVSIIVGQSVPELCQLTHAILIQEWHIFLDAIFKEAVFHYLKNKQRDKLPKIRLQLKRLELETLSSLRESISEATEAAFSSMPYQDRLKKLIKLLNITPDDNLKKIMNKHRLIRNCLQHNRGIIRLRDLPMCGYLELINDTGQKIRYVKGQSLNLSHNDVLELNSNIKDFSQEFEVVL